MDSAFASPATETKHIIDVLIEERAPKLSASPAWPALKPALYAILNYARARQMADAIGPMGGRDALEHVSGILGVRVEQTGLERIPRDGSFIALANHPTGITDGIAFYDSIKTVRPDAVFYANSDAHRVCPQFDEALIPVEWVLTKRTRERTRITLKMTEQAVSEGRPIVIFPAGRLARKRSGVLTDPEWMSSSVSIARKYKLPILPVHVAGPYAFWFHLFDKFSAELRDITLFHELLNKRGKTYALTYGPLIPADVANGDPTTITRKIKHYVERVLPHAQDCAFDVDGPECSWRDPAKI